MFSGLFRPEHLLSIRLWLFLYLVICIGSHMAPSAQDYRGAVKGGLFVLVILVALSIGLSLAGTVDTPALIASALVPPVTIMIAATILVALATAMVFLITGLFRTGIH